MFDDSLPQPAELAAVDDADLQAALAGWAATAAAAEARKLAVIAELRRRADTGELRERDAIDDADATAAVVSCALAVTHGKALGQIDLACTLRDRLPKIGARFLAGEISSRMISTIAWRTFLVSAGAVAVIDAEIADRAAAWGPLSDAKLDRAIDLVIDRHDPDAVRRTRAAMRGRHFTVGDRDDSADGTVSVHGRLTATDAALTHERLAVMVRGVCPADPRTMDQRRADAVGAVMAGSLLLKCLCDNADCTAKLDDGRATHIVVNVIAEQDSLDADPDPLVHGEHSSDRAKRPAPAHEPARRNAALVPSLNGAIVPASLLAELIIHGARVRVVDPGSRLAEPGYRPSAALQRFIRSRDITCRFPGCTRPAVHADIDHTTAWPDGSTHPANLKCYCRTHHLIKTFVAGWRDDQQPDGTVTVTTPAGLRYSTKPLSRLLFPDWNTNSPPAPPPAHQRSRGAGRDLMMPTRQRTRAENRASYIATERRLNAAERAHEPDGDPIDSAPPPF